MKITIEYEGEYKIDTVNELFEIKGGYRSIYANESTNYELILPKEAKVKIVIQETDVHKEKVLENVTIKIDSKVDGDKLKQELYDAVTNQLKHLKLY